MKKLLTIFLIFSATLYITVKYFYKPRYFNKPANLLEHSSIKDKNDKIVNEEIEIKSELDNSTSNSPELFNVNNLKDEILEIEKEIANLEARRKKVINKREQFFRVSERGVEVELERRLSRLEYERLLSKAYFGKNKDDAREYELSEIDNLEQQDIPGDDVMDDSVGDIPSENTTKDWWKMID
jgi:hypothetical protein